MKNPLISVIVPVYNVEKYINKCVDSIISQTYNNLEIYLVNDGSPDLCGDICDNYSKSDNRIKVIHKGNGGLSDARNVALDLIHGVYVIFIDSDDFVATDYIETLYELIKTYNAQIAVSLFYDFKEEEEVIIQQFKGKIECHSAIKALQIMNYQKQFDNTAWGKLYKTSLFSGIRYPKGLIYEDLPTTYKLFLNAEKIVSIDYKSYYYLIRDTSIEGSEFSEYKLNCMLKVVELLENDSTNFREAKRSFDCRIISFLFHILMRLPKTNTGRIIVIHKIKKYRFNVLLDPNARFKTRIACLLTYFDIDFMNVFFSIINRRRIYK